MRILSALTTTTVQATKNHKGPPRDTDVALPVKHLKINEILARLQLSLETIITGQLKTNS